LIPQGKDGDENEERKGGERTERTQSPQPPNLLQSSHTTNSQALAERSVQEKKAKREEEEKKIEIRFSKGEWNKVEGVRGSLKAPPFAPTHVRGVKANSHRIGKRTPLPSTRKKTVPPTTTPLFPSPRIDQSQESRELPKAPPRACFSPFSSKARAVFQTPSLFSQISEISSRVVAETT